MTRPVQLHLWKRPLRGPPAVEFRLHCAIADLIRRMLAPGWRWTHLPFGEYRPPATAARLKRMGTGTGWPDLLFVHERGRVCWLELKRRGARLTRDQEELAHFLAAAGHAFAVADTYAAARDMLIKWDVLKPEAKHDGTEAQRQWRSHVLEAG